MADGCLGRRLMRLSLSTCDKFINNLIRFDGSSGRTITKTQISVELRISDFGLRISDFSFPANESYGGRGPLFDGFDKWIGKTRLKNSYAVRFDF